MYWLHGTTKLRGDTEPRIITSYGPYTSMQTIRRVHLHIQDTIARCGGLDLDYVVSKKKKALDIQSHCGIL